MIKKIIKKIDLEKDIKLMSPIDEIKLSINSDNFCYIIENYKSRDPIERYIQHLLCRKESDVMDLLSDNYFNNILGSIYFIISNPFSIDTKIFDIIYKNRKLIKNVPLNIIDSYETVIGNEKKKLYKFYNYDIIVKWNKTVICEKMKQSEYYKISKLSDEKKEKKWERYNLVWDEFNDACVKLKDYIQVLLKFYKPLKISVVGCSHFGKNYYEYCLESYIGMKVEINKLEKWANSELLKLINEMKEYIKIIIDKPIKDSETYKSLLNKIYNDESQKFKSKSELVKLYTEAIEKYQKIYVKKLNFPQYEKVNLVIFNNPDLGGGYYYLNNFYLNTFNWKKMRKYTIESLVLHETTPGHHTQVHTSFNISNKHSLLFAYLGSSCTGFIEGWGLFSEKLGFEQSIWDKIGQLEFEIFRTLRIIIDIGIHYHGKTPSEMIEFMENNLTMSHEEVVNEIYRYICYPGQAVAYKVGEHVFKKILEKKNIKSMLEPSALELYKKLIIDGPKPLKFICSDYNINKNDLFRN